MKTINKLLALVLMAVAMVFASCSKDNDGTPTQQEIETKIVGQWKVKSYEGKEYTTNQQTIYTFRTDGTFTVSASKPIRIQNGQHYWANKVKLPYSINGNNIFVTGIEGNNLSINVLRLTDSEMEVAEQGEHSHTLTKIAPNNFANDIIGLWEGVSMTGDETYGNAEARIEYYADGTYTYFEKYADIWYPSDDVDNEYNVDGDWLATRWRPAEGADYNYEWWDIDEIKDGMMKWSALRERADGSRYTTTFTWKKVDTPTEEQYKAMILGEWKDAGVDFYWFKNGELARSTMSAMLEEIWTFNPDDTFSEVAWNNDGTKLMESYGHYELSGSVLSIMHERMFVEGEPFDVSELAFPVEIYGISKIDKDNLCLAAYTKYKMADSDGIDHCLIYSRFKRP